MVLFDRSWYNRAGVERVMGFCTEEEYREFLRSCPEFERMLLRSGIILLKYWFSVSDAEQERRFQRASRTDPALEAQPHGPQVPRHVGRVLAAKDDMFHYTDTKQSRGGWWWPTTSAGRASTASATCSSGSPTAT